MLFSLDHTATAAATIFCFCIALKVSLSDAFLGILAFILANLVPTKGLQLEVAVKN